MPVSARPICLADDSEALRTRLCGSAISSEAPAQTYATATGKRSSKVAPSFSGTAPLASGRPTADDVEQADANGSGSGRPALRPRRYVPRLAVEARLARETQELVAVDRSSRAV